MNNYAKPKRAMISPIQLFFVLFVSRIVVTLTYVQTVSVGRLGGDFLFSIALSYILTMLLSIPIILCLKWNKKTVLMPIYAIYFIWLTAVNISRFSYFASSRISANSSMAFFVFAIAAASCYCAVLGIEGISRFGSFCGVLLVLTVAIVFAFNIHNLEQINFYPIELNSRFDILKNALVMTSNSTEPALLLIISNRVHGAKIKPLLAGVSASYLTVFMLIVFVVGVMGSSASMQAYPIFTLFQMASVGSFSRLDMLHTAFWVLALLLKSSLYIYSSSIAIKRYTHRNKCVFVSAMVAVTALIVVFVLGTGMIEITKYVSTISFALFVFVLPLISSIKGRKQIENS